MKFSLLLVAWVASCVLAYDLPGAYERMFLWYARELQRTTLGTGDRITIASGCTEPCTFNKFIAFITDPRPTRPANIVPEANLTPGVETTARALFQSGLTGRYSFRRIFSGATSTADLLKGISAEIATDTDKAPGLVRAGVRNAVNGVRFYRIVAASDAKVAALRQQFPGIDIIFEKREMQTDDRGTLVEANVINEGNTLAHNEKNFNRDRMRAVMAAQVDDQHEANIKAAAQALNRFSVCKVRPDT